MFLLITFANPLSLMLLVFIISILAVSRVLIIMDLLEHILIVLDGNVFFTELGFF